MHDTRSRGDMNESRKPRVIQLQARASGWSDYSFRVRKLAFHAYGHEFLSVALKTGSLPVRAYLLGHSLELFLKTYLLHLDLRMSTAELKRIGHNLERLLATCEREGLKAVTSLSEGIRSDLVVLSAAYDSKALQYFSLLYLLAPPRLPELRRLVRFARVLDVSLARLFGAA